METKQALVKQQASQFYIFQDQVSGKTAKLISKDNSTVYKNLSQQQHRFYEYMDSVQIGDPNRALLNFIPQYLGTIIVYPKILKHQHKATQGQKQWLQHIHSRIQNTLQPKIGILERGQHFLTLKNINQNYQYSNIMDIKLGTKKFKTSNVKFIDSTTQSKKFRINGMNVLLLNNKSGLKQKQYFLSKYYGQKIKQQEIESHLAFYFFNGDVINQKLLRSFVIDLKKMVLAIKAFRGKRFLSSSLLLTYDPYYPNLYNLKLIDFDKMQDSGYDCCDQNICEGIINLHYYFQEILERKSTHQVIIKTQKLRFFHQFAGVPEQKIKKYQNTIKKKEEL